MKEPVLSEENDKSLCLFDRKSEWFYHWRYKVLIETDRLIITEFTPDMAQVVQENSVDEDNKRFVPDEVWETTEEAEEKLRNLGATVTSSVTKTTTALILGEKPGKSKLEKAEKLGIPTMNEEEFLELIG